MAADLHIHVCTNKEEEEAAIGFKKHTFWSSEIGPGYREFLVNNEWLHENDFYSLSEQQQEDFYKEIEEYAKQNPNTSYPGIRDVACPYDDHVIDKTPHIWVGEVSWLKAAIFEDEKTFVPDPIMKVADLIDRDANTFVVIDDELIENISNAFNLDNTTSYSLESKENIVDFLKQYKGKKCFTISW